MTARQGLTFLAGVAVAFWLFGLALVSWAPAEGQPPPTSLPVCTAELTAGWVPSDGPVCVAEDDPGWLCRTDAECVAELGPEQGQ